MRGGSAVALLHQIAKNSHEESRGADVEALVKGLAGHAKMVPVLEVARDLVQGRQSGGHGAEQGLEETGGGDFAGMAGDRKRVWLAMRSRSGRLGHERPAGKAFDIPSLPARSPRQAFI